MFELFPDGPVHEYPQLVNVTFSFVWAFLLASLIAITHKLTFSGEHYPKNFFQALVLGSVVTTMVMMAIGDSLARGLGVFGAMAIIRFRTRIDDPRDVLFLFAALSTGLAVGVYGFTISFAGTILFCIVAFLLHVSPFKSFAQQHHLFFTLNDSKDLPKVLLIVAQYCYDHRQISVQLNKENAMRYEYGVSLKKNTVPDQMIEELKSIEGIRMLRLATNESVNPQ
jgi:uncharacterized membrane protein YhiD involved in acid resistance